MLTNWLGLGSLFKGTSTFSGYLKPRLSLQNNSIDTISPIDGGLKGSYLSRGISPKVNVIANFKAAVQCFNHYALETPPHTHTLSVVLSWSLTHRIWSHVHDILFLHFEATRLSASNGEYEFWEGNITSQGQHLSADFPLEWWLYKISIRIANLKNKKKQSHYFPEMPSGGDLRGKRVGQWHHSKWVRTPVRLLRSLLD